MSQHLSSQQILEWMNGEYSAQAREHVSQCGPCAAQVERLTDSLDLFRVSLRGAAEKLPERQTVLQMPRRKLAVRWATVAAAVALLASLPVYKVRQAERRAEIARQDAELLDQVNAELSSGVAAPMKPLEKMVSWDSGTQKHSDSREF